MSWVTLLTGRPCLMSKNTLLKQQEMVPENTSGPEVKAQTVSGTDSIPKYSLSREVNTLIRRTLGTNTTMIRMTSTRPPSKETSSNTTTKTTSPVETINGSSSESESTSLHPLTLHIL